MRDDPIHNTKAVPLEELYKIDPAHEKLDIFSQPITKDVWFEKYAYHTALENHPYNTFERVCAGIYVNDLDEEREKALHFMKLGIWMPGGRIIAGAGTEKHVTLMNCYVNRTLDDSMEGIADGVRDTMLTLRQGGGIGTDFSTLRPKGAALKRLGDGSESSGALSFMHIWDAACKTIMSAGARRGAMMGTMICTHPDLPDFITAKQKEGVLTQFNVSVLVTDAFLKAVAEDAEWKLYFKQPPVNASNQLPTFVDDKGVRQYVYKVMPARELWDMILKCTYEHAEPGVIFIDRVNQLNNLRYCEDIQCTNPCGEQPLPPNGTCNLGAINLARLVEKPFTKEASLNFWMLRNAARMGVRFLDNVIDVTRYPLPEQETEERSKRRLGLGISGLANAMAMLGMRYGSIESVEFTRRVMSDIACSAYRASCDLARERGKFRLYDKDEIIKAPFISKLPREEQDLIGKYGLRNGVLMTIAPTGTTSLLFGNISSGLEPVFAYHTKRKILQPDGSKKQYDAYDYGYLLYHSVMNAEPGSIDLPECMIEADQISVEGHINVQAACQQWIDASISKTINCPADISYEDFKEVYTFAYMSGCKGCTTYRPSGVRGSVLEKASEVIEDLTAAERPLEPPSNEAHVLQRATEVKGTPQTTNERPEILQGETIKVKWPNREGALYLTLNWLNGKPYEFFIASRTSENQEWISSLTRMISAIMRQGIDITFVAEELQQISSAHDSAWVAGKHFNSLPAYMGYILEQGIKRGSPGGVTTISRSAASEELPKILAYTQPEAKIGDTCPKCFAPTLIHKEGCKACTQCGYSNCG